MYVQNYFNLEDQHVDSIRELVPKFGYNGYGEIIYYRTYSRKKPKDDIEANQPRKSWSGQESWHDTVLRVVNGTFTIRKDHYIRNHIPWDEKLWQSYARNFAESMFKMYWMPPGRGLWAMGTPFIYERGSMALYNCAYTDLTSDNLADDLAWMMDSLMVGCGVGWKATTDYFHVYDPEGEFINIISDDREGWVNSVKLEIEAYTRPGRRRPKHQYHLIRPKGMPIEGFGGLASGPEPLMKLHGQIRMLFERYKRGQISLTQLKADLANIIGCCVVAGNVRRSAEIGLASVQDQIFLDLKDYNLYPERAEYGWMSNNTVMFEDDSDFKKLGEIAKRVPVRGEPGVANLRNFPKGRLNGKKLRGRKDRARGSNPCGEITLEHRETCNVVETCPTNCPDVDTWYRACEYACLYASTVSLLPTHQPSTNAVVMRNRRIGVGIIDYTGWVAAEGQHNVIRYLRKGYDIVRQTNAYANGEAGVPEAIKVTTIKPGGTVPKLVGKTPGAGFATFGHTLRRTRLAANSPMVPILQEAGIPMEPEVNDPLGTLVFEYPIHQSGRPADEVSIWEQALNIVTLQREWSDNAVSNTIYFKPKWTLLAHEWQEDEIWRVIHEHGWTYQEVCEVPHSADAPLNASMESVLHKGDKRLTLKESADGVCEVKIHQWNPLHEEDMIEPVLSSIMPSIKMVSFLPHSAKGVYPQMPESGLSKEEYLERLNWLDAIDWSKFHGSDGDDSDDKYCSGGFCVIPQPPTGSYAPSTDR